MDFDDDDEPFGEEPQRRSSSWLCPDDLDRGRMIDMQRRMHPSRRRTYAVLAAGLLVAGPWLGWLPLLMVVPASLCYKAADIMAPRVARPEYVWFAAWIVSALAIAGAASVSGGLRSGLIYWLAIPIITLSSRFSTRGVIAGVGISVALMPVIAVVGDGHAVAGGPALVIVPLALFLCLPLVSMPLMRSDIDHRSDAVIDKLTGLFNRTGLSVRVMELAQQSRLTGQPVGVIVGDLDHFKAINDEHGHAVGDEVLENVAYVVRKQLRAFDLAYRLGGEEFLILLPESNLGRCVELAERLREAVAANEGGAARVTMSFGVSASRGEVPFEYESVFAEADAALYEAKRNGRDQVCLAEWAEAPTAPAAALASSSPVLAV